VSTSLLRFLLLGALAMPLFAHGQIYKWTDQQGVTNYGNKPPRNAANVTTLQAESNLSTIPLVVPRELPRQIQPADALLLEARAAQLERMAIASSFERPVILVPDPAVWRDRCFTELRVDCLRPTPATYDYIPGFNPGDLSRFGLGRF
jgi:hypothetical protein